MNDERMKNNKILPLLVEFSLPAIIGMLVNAIYNVVDRIFIGNAPQLGALGLAGISITYPVTLILMAISLMIGVGGATRFSIALGMGKREDAAKYMGNGLTLTVILGLIFTIAGCLFLNPILKILGASQQVLPYAQRYLSIILYGSVFQCVAMAGNNFSRAQGNPKNAMVSQLIGAGFNILFDYILIVCFKMGMEGAALATIGGQFLSAIWQLVFLFGKRTIISLNLSLMKLKWLYAIDIIKTGIPAFLMQMSNSVLNIILNATLLQYGGDVALSAIGIVTSVQTILLMPLTGLTQGQQPLISYNYGARLMDRVKETLKYAMMGAIIIDLIGFIGVEFFTKTIVYMFNNDQSVVSLGVDSLRIWFMMLPVIGIQIVCANYFQAVGKITVSSFLNLLRQVIILIPAILLLAHIFGLYGIFYAVPFADACAFIITVILLIRELKKEGVM
ncbi:MULTISPECIES: MATE family efflux transporter [Coprobacillaceae]|uniref:MATE family efflux transporter n=1 Tax=Coprobacillaceae TaxID=2810280 RepID=UPI000E543388|nr:MULTISPECIES: MATE family efflux transporter [Coprobacillaceae]RHM58963.1 MATE family efflux transporter [Coprobacillus sp. AF33-1AC]RHS91370.1 MATE family efflux transporter [Erysipelatoclostridium sp. AM42-17]